MVNKNPIPPLLKNKKQLKNESTKTVKNKGDKKPNVMKSQTKVNPEFVYPYSYLVEVREG